MNNRLLSAIALVIVSVTLLASASLIGGSDAQGEDLSETYGEPSIIDIAPGFDWRYTPTFPDDLLEYLTVSFEVNDSDIGRIDGGTVIVSIPSTAASGTIYNVVMVASMTEPVEQIAYQYVQFRVVDGLSVSGTINDIIAGTPISFTPNGESDMGPVTWTVMKGTTLPEGLELADGKVTGTPTGIGEQTVSLTATAKGQSADLVVSFTVFSEIAGDGDESITSYGTPVSSRTIQNASDIGVTWAVTAGVLPEGFSLDPSTGAVSGSSDIVQRTTVTITGTSTLGPEQTVTKDITITSEPALVLAPGGDILTYRGNSAPVTSAIGFPQTSAIAWSVSGYDGAEVSDGVVSVADPAIAGMDHALTVTAVTEYGQTVTVDIGLAVEDTLTISGASGMSAIAGTEKVSEPFAIAGGSDNTVEAHTDTVGPNVSVSDGRLVFSSSAPIKGCAVDVTVTSAAGQTASFTVTVDVYNVLVFVSKPTGGAVIYPM